MKIVSFDVGVKNLAYCALRDDGGIEAWEVYGVDPSTTREPEKLCPEVARTLDERWPTAFRDADVVVIERQPGKNRKMKTVEAYLHMYFAVRGKRVVLFSPSKKLAGEDAGMHGKSKYHLRKKTSVILVDDLLKDERNAAFTDFFKNSKKKDDLADCLMQGLAFFREGPSTIAHPVRARKPTANQERTKRYTKANIKYLIDAIDTSTVLEIFDGDEEEGAKRALIRVVEKDVDLRKAVLRHYATVRACLDSLYKEKEKSQQQEQEECP